MSYSYHSRHLLILLVACTAACMLSLSLGCRSSVGPVSSDLVGQAGETPSASIIPATAAPPVESVVAGPSPEGVNTQPGFYLLYQAGREQEEIYGFDFADSWPVAPGDLVSGQPLSPDRKRIIITMRPASKRDSTRSFAVLDLEHGTIEPLPLLGQQLERFWSPDGRQVMYVSYEEDEGQLVVYDFEKGENIVLVDGEAIWSTAGWSADGELAAFVTVTDGQYDLYLLEVDSLAVRRLTNTKDIETAAVWSPVRNELLVGTTVYTEHALELWPFPVDNLSIITSDGQERDLGRYDYLHSSSLAWSVDGERVAYSETGKLCVLSLGDGKRSCPLVGLEPYDSYYAAFDAPPVWSPDNHWLAFRAAGYDDGGSCEAVYALELATNEVVVVEEGSCESGNLYWAGE